MKHAFALVMLAGSAGGYWYHQQDRTAAGTKLQIPDPGLDDLGAAAPEWKPLEIDLLAPVDDLPNGLVAELSSPVQTISNQQPVESPDARRAAVKQPSVTRSSDFEPVETSAAEESNAPASDVRPGDQSVEGRPINVRKLGQGKFRTVIITGLDGRDVAAVQWADELAEALENRPELLNQQEFVIVRAANPDGLAAHIRENSRGVHLNRNFPTRRYQHTKTPSSGAGPASEPETRALLQTLYELRPQRVVHLCSTSGKSAVFVNQQAGDVAERLQRRHRLPVERLNYDQLPGSLEEFCDATWNSSIVLLHLHGVPEQEVAEKLLPPVISAIAWREPASRSTIAPVSTPRAPSRWQNGPSSSPVPAPVYQSDRPRPVLRRGYEELPPPPQ
jgi:protein MpaA